MGKINDKYEREKKEKAIGMITKLLELIQTGTYKVNIADFWVTGLEGRVRFSFDVTDMSVLDGTDGQN